MDLFPYPHLLLPIPSLHLPPNQLESLGEHCKLPQWGPGQNPAHKCMCAIFQAQKMYLVSTKLPLRYRLLWQSLVRSAACHYGFKPAEELAVCQTGPHHPTSSTDEWVHKHVSNILSFVLCHSGGEAHLTSILLIVCDTQLKCYGSGRWRLVTRWTDLHVTLQQTWHLTSLYLDT